MKEKLIEALRTKFDGVNDKILGRIAEKLAKTITSEEQVATAVEGVTFQSVLESYGDSRATEAQQTAVKNYEAKYNLKDGKPNDGGTQQPPAPPKKPEEEAPAWAKALVEENKKLAERLNAIDKEKTSANRRTQLNAVIEKLPEFMRKAYEHVSVDSLTDEDFETLKGTITDEVSVASKELQAKGAVFGQPARTNKPTNTKEASDAELSAVASKLGI